MDAEADKDDASLLAAALAEIELLGAEADADSSDSSSLRRDHAKRQAADADADADVEPNQETHEAVSLDDEEEPTPQIKEEETPYPHIFAIGDAADAFGALPAGHNAWAQGEVAGRNVLRLISCYGGNVDVGEGCEGKKREEDEELETYTPGPPAIKVSLGLVSFLSTSSSFPVLRASLLQYLPPSLPLPASTFHPALSRTLALPFPSFPSRTLLLLHFHFRTGRIADASR
jgi:hypothetical protein